MKNTTILTRPLHLIATGTSFGSRPNTLYNIQKHPENYTKFQLRTHHRMVEDKKINEVEIIAYNEKTNKWCSVGTIPRERYWLYNYIANKGYYKIENPKVVGGGKLGNGERRTRGFHFDLRWKVSVPAKEAAVATEKEEENA